MDDFFKNGISIDSKEYENFIFDIKSYKITGIYINKYDLSQFHLNQEVTNFPIIVMGNGLIIELNDSINYKFCSGFFVSGYFLKILKINDKTEYINIQDLNISNLNKLINKQANSIDLTTFHNEETVITKLEINFTDNMDKVLFVGSNFVTNDRQGIYEYYEGAWIITDKTLINNLKLL